MLILLIEWSEKCVWKKYKNECLSVCLGWIPIPFIRLSWNFGQLLCACPRRFLTSYYLLTIRCGQAFQTNECIYFNWIFGNFIVSTIVVVFFRMLIFLFSPVNFGTSSTGTFHSVCEEPNKFNSIDDRS